MTDPLRTARQRERIIVVAGAAAVALAAAWAARPISVRDHPLPDLRARQQAPAEANPTSSLDLAAFGARIWNPRPDPVAPAAAEAKPAEPPPAPLRLQLVAIVRDGDELRAALYDPDANELRLVRVGDAVARYTITLVDAAGVELHPPGAADPRRLDLIPPGGPR